MSFDLLVGNVDTRIVCAPGQTVLDAAVMAGIDYPYACASGNCGACISRLDRGTVHLLPRGDAALSRAQLEGGLTLACRAQPRSDIAVTWLGRGRK